MPKILKEKDVAVLHRKGKVNIKKSVRPAPKPKEAAPKPDPDLTRLKKIVNELVASSRSSREFARLSKSLISLLEKRMDKIEQKVDTTNGHNVTKQSECQVIRDSDKLIDKVLITTTTLQEAT